MEMHNYARVFVHAFCTRRQRLLWLSRLGLHLHERTQCQPYVQRELYAHPMTVEDGVLCALPFRAQPSLERAALAPLSPHYRESAQKLPCRSLFSLTSTGPSWWESDLRVRASRASCRSGGKSWRKNGRIRYNYRLSGSRRGCV